MFLSDFPIPVTTSVYTFRGDVGWRIYLSLQSAHPQPVEDKAFLEFSLLFDFSIFVRLEDDIFLGMFGKNITQNKRGIHVFIQL